MVVPRENATSPRFSLKKVAPVASRPLPPEPGEAREIPVRREEIVMVTEPRSQIAEQFRGLRNSIQALNPDSASHTLVVTSALRGEGPADVMELTRALASISTA